MHEGAHNAQGCPDSAPRLLLGHPVPCVPHPLKGGHMGTVLRGKTTSRYNRQSAFRRQGGFLTGSTLPRAHTRGAASDSSSHLVAFTPVAPSPRGKARVGVARPGASKKAQSHVYHQSLLPQTSPGPTRARLGSLLDLPNVAVRLPRVLPDMFDAPTRARSRGAAYNGPTCLLSRSRGCGATSVVGRLGHPKKALVPSVALTAVSVVARDAKKTSADSASIGPSSETFETPMRAWARLARGTSE